jgi:hypothetical protein
MTSKATIPQNVQSVSGDGAGVSAGVVLGEEADRGVVVEGDVVEGDVVEGDVVEGLGEGVVEGLERGLGVGAEGVVEGLERGLGEGVGEGLERGLGDGLVFGNAHPVGGAASAAGEQQLRETPAGISIVNADNAVEPNDVDPSGLTFR